MDYDWFDEVQERGGDICPTCGRFAKVYHRRLDAGIIRQLLKMYAMTGTEPADRPILMPLSDANVITTAKHWGVDHSP